MSVYLDANVLVALFFPDDPFHSKAHAFLRKSAAHIIVSDFAAAEFTSVVARQVRSGAAPDVLARNVFQLFDTWTEAATERVHLDSRDVRLADSFLRRLDLNLRTPDAIHLAIAQRLNAELSTFDKALSVCARVLRMPLAAT